MVIAIIKVVIRLMRESAILRHKFKQTGDVKQILFRKKATAKYIRQRLMIGVKV